MKEEFKILRERLLGILATAAIAAGIAFLTVLGENLTGGACTAADPLTAGAAGAALRGSWQLLVLGSTTHGG